MPNANSIRVATWWRHERFPASGYLMQPTENSGRRAGTRTRNPLIKSQLLCQLSYAPAGGNLGDHHHSRFQVKIDLKASATGSGRRSDRRRSRKAGRQVSRSIMPSISVGLMAESAAGGVANDRGGLPSRFEAEPLSSTRFVCRHPLRQPWSRWLRSLLSPLISPWAEDERL